MIKLIDILENKILVPRRSKEERDKNYKIALQKKIQQYIKGGSKGNFELKGTPLTSLPDNLTKVGGYLDLENSKITTLPDNLQVGGDLFLRKSKITSLPNNLKVGGDLWLGDTPLSDEITSSKWWYLNPYSDFTEKYSKKQIKKMIENKGGYVKGRIYI